MYSMEIPPMTYCLEDKEGALWINYMGLTKREVISQVECSLGEWVKVRREGFHIVEVTVVKGRL